MTDKPRAGEGLDPEMLAAYIDKRLPPDVRAAVEAQLAIDPDRYELLVELMKAQDELGDLAATPASPQPARVVAMPRSSKARRWVMAGGVFAAAAAVILVVRLQPDLISRMRGSETDPRLERLVAALGEERTVEGRLTGGFKYGPLRDVTRDADTLGGGNLSLLAAAGELQKAAEADPTPDNLHALGVAQLLIGDYDASVRSLRAAIDQAPPTAAYQSDVASALLARATALSRPEDLAPALSAADQALRLSATLLEARFNRALALEALRLDEQAIEAYDAFLALDGSSGWADEARRRRDALQAKPRASAWSPDQPVTIATAFRARDWLHDVALPQWSSSVLAAQADGGLATRIERVARELQSVTGDRLAAVIADEIAQGPAGSTARDLASGHAAFAKARESVRADRVPDAGREIRAACAAFRTAQSQMQPACEIELAGIYFQERDFTRLRSEVTHLLPVLRRERFRAATARAYWLQSLLVMLEGRLADSATPARMAREEFEAVGEWPSAARMWSLESDAEYWSGRYQQSWRLRARALDLAAQSQDPYASFVVLSAVSGVLLNEQLPGPAGVFAQASTIHHGQPVPPLMQLYPLHRGLLAAVEAGDLDLARRMRTQIERITATHTADRRLQGMQIDINVAVAALHAAEGDARAAETMLSEAITKAGPEREFSTPIWARLGRAELYLRTGDTDSARTDLDIVIDKLVRRSGRAVTLRVSDIGRVRRAVARLALDEQGQNRDSLALYEKARSALFDERYLTPAGSVNAVSLPGASTAILVYVDDGERLGCWVLKQGGATFRPLSSSAADVRRMAFTLAFLAERSAAGSEPWITTLRALDRLLLEPLRSDLADVSHVSVVTDAATKAVPFGALIDANNRPAGSRWTLSMTPSVSAATDLSVSVDSRAKSVLVIGDPGGPGMEPLPGAKGEAAAVGAIYGLGGRLLSGGAATRGSIEAALPGADVIHFAGHAVSDSNSPGRSYLQLAASAESPDGRWKIEDFRPHMFRGDQVVILAACRGADAVTDVQESVSSLAEAILRAGAGAVVANLWPISDSRSRALFELLHQRLRAGLAVDAALQAAQADYMKSYDDPAAIAAWSGAMVFRAGPGMEAS